MDEQEYLHAGKWELKRMVKAERQKKKKKKQEGNIIRKMKSMGTSYLQSHDLIVLQRGMEFFASQCLLYDVLTWEGWQNTDAWAPPAEIPIQWVWAEAKQWKKKVSFKFPKWF